DIRTYDRLPGRRLLMPWTAAGTAGGSIQLDLVFNEPLPIVAEPTDLRPLGDGPGSRLLAASPELSLAWKLLWLVSDAYPQGKDLYDAVLLAEHTPLAYEVLRDAFVVGGFEGLRPPGRWWFATLDVGNEWEHFTAEHPWVQETADHFKDRLDRHLTPLLDAAEQHDPYTQWAHWLHPL
ncbi:nucleotidyl transferase AbiEii/AbiGii toxin family protein, partial [Streptomyces sp. H39-S7]|uniref:nucleotidyl transferase AbiEii/AbiGii toxin family protein n=1 Tax=Streptomyces sp. H39-S7 TaxID=3004357 RepID=UPI0022AECC57